MSYAAKVFLWLREELFISGRLLGNSVRMVDYGRQQWKQQVCGFGLTEGGTNVEKKLDKKTNKMIAQLFACSLCIFIIFLTTPDRVFMCNSLPTIVLSTWYIRGLSQQTRCVSPRWLWRQKNYNKCQYIISTLDRWQVTKLHHNCYVNSHTLVKLYFP